MILIIYDFYIIYNKNIYLFAITFIAIYSVFIIIEIKLIYNYIYIILKSL